VYRTEAACRSSAEAARRWFVGAVWYEIGVRGRLGPELLTWFEALEVRAVEAGVTYLCGRFADQSALQGVLKQFAELGIEVASLRELPQAG
jgi:hypothetical protein